MHLAVGTTNTGKIQAVERACALYDALKGATVTGVSVPSGVADQPMSLEEIITGAKNRAKGAYESGTFSLAFGIESGIFPVPHTKSEYMDTSCCAIYDGQDFHLGLAPCFEYPKKIIQAVLNRGLEITDAAVAAGFFADREERTRNGMVGRLTGNRVTRIDYTLLAIQMAMVHLENAEHYRSF